MRGGRGGGRGRGRSAPGPSQMLLRETQMDLGIDTFGYQPEAPVLYPRMDLPGPVRVMEADAKQIARARQSGWSDITKSPYYIASVDRDLACCWDAPREGRDQRRSLASQLPPVMTAYLPPELMDCSSAAAKVGTRRALPDLQPLPAFDAKTLSALEYKERKNAEAGDIEKDREKDKEDAGMMSDIEGEQEEEHDDDYAVDHYESGDESAGDDEPAAVF